MIEQIRHAFERGQRRYPAVDLAFDDFMSRIQAILASLTAPGVSGPEARTAPAAALGRLHCEDLFLAIACARGDRVAWEHFADDFLPALRRHAAAACRQLSEGEDLAQEIVAALLENRQRLSGYNGLGSLAGWLRVSAAHAAIDRFRRAKRQVSLEELNNDGRGSAKAAAAQVCADLPESLDAGRGDLLLAALSEEIRRLPARDRLLLSLYYCHDVTLQSIGQRFGVHEATASRWLDRLRRGLRKRIEREMKRRHGLGPRDLLSLWQWISEKGDFSLQEAVAGCKNGQPDRPMKGASNG